MPQDLTAAEVAALTEDGNHRCAHGLYLAIRQNGAAKSWLLRYKRNGNPRWHGLGSARLFTYTDAKRRAIAAQKMLADGIDPVDAKSAEREAERLAASVPDFAACVDSYIAEHEAAWKNEKHRYQWRQSLDSYAAPVLGAMAVNKITTDDVVKALKPIWTTKTETAVRLRGRIEKVLGWARSKGYRDGANPAVWADNISHHLPQPGKVRKRVHHVAVPYPGAPAVYAALADKKAISATVLRFIMLTAVRFNEAAGATWGEFDLDRAEWIIPAERMKMDTAHRVPLSVPAVALLKARRPRNAKPGDLVFAGHSDGKSVSDTAARNMLRRVGPDDADTHGLRSTFRDWAAEQTDCPREIAEAALAHEVGSDVERAYRRTDFYDKRVALMDDWGKFLIGDHD